MCVRDRGGQGRRKKKIGFWKETSFGLPKPILLLPPFVAVDQKMDFGKCTTYYDPHKGWWDKGTNTKSNSIKDIIYLKGSRYLYSAGLKIKEEWMKRGKQDQINGVYSQCNSPLKGLILLTAFLLNQSNYSIKSTIFPFSRLCGGLWRKNYILLCTNSSEIKALFPGASKQKKTLRVDMNYVFYIY